MASGMIAAGATAFGLYVYAQQSQQCGFAGVRDFAYTDTHLLTEQPPTSWSETLYLFKEALRYVYQETFARWSALDLFFGLAFLARRDTERYPAADIAATGHPLEVPSPAAAQQLLQELRKVRRYMLYCQGLRHRTEQQQCRHWAEHLGTEPEHIIAHRSAAGLLRPAWSIVADHECHEVLLVVRGTNSRADLFTSLTGVVKPHHVLTEEQGVALGYSHLGMLAAARWLMAETKELLLEAAAAHPQHQVRLVGHSMGGGTAALLTMMLREKVPQFADVTCWSIACPACATLSLSRGCAHAVTSLLHGTDIVPTFSSGTIDALREQVVRSSWFADFRASVRQQLAGSLGRFSRSTPQLSRLDLDSAQQQPQQQQQSVSWGRTPSIMARHGMGYWGASGVLSRVASSLTACYQRRPRSVVVHRTASGSGSMSGALLPLGHSEADALLRAMRRSQDGRDAPAAVAPDDDVRMERAVADVILERALEHALEGVTSGLLPVGSAGHAAGGALPVSSSSSSSRTRETQLPYVAGFPARDTMHSAGHISSGHSSSSGSALRPGGAVMVPRSRSPGMAAAYDDATAQGSFVQKAASAVLGIGSKRPVALGKKDDDAPLETTAAAAAPGTGAGGGVTTGSAAAPGTAAAAAAGADSTTGGGAATSPQPAQAAAAAEAVEPAAAAASGTSISMSSAGLRRRGWAPWDLLGQGGWVQEPSGDGSAAVGVGRAMAALGQTVNTTGRLVAATTGQLLRGPGLMFQACRVQGVAEGGGVAWQQDWKRSSSSNAGSIGEGGLDSAASLSSPFAPAAAPWTPTMTAGRSDGGATPWHAAAAAAGVAGASSAAAAGVGGEDLLDSEDEGLDEGEGDDDSEVDPDLGGAGALGDPDAELDTAAVTASISAVVAAVTSSELAAAAGDGSNSSSCSPGGSAVQSQPCADGSPTATNIPGSSSTGSRRASTASAAAAQGSPSRAPSRTGDSPAAAAHGAAGPSAAAAGAGGQALPASPVRGPSAGCAAASYYSKKLERKANRQMYPLGRLLHLMPMGARLQGASGTSGAAAEAAAAAGGGGGAAGGRASPAGGAAPAPSADTASSTAAAAAGAEQAEAGRVPRPSTSAGAAGYELLEVPNPEVYGRVVLCRTMVRDHFIPSYLRALDSVLAQLEQQASAGAPAAAATGGGGGVGDD